MKMIFLFAFGALLFAALATMGCSPTPAPAPPVVTVIYPTQVSPTQPQTPTADNRPPTAAPTPLAQPTVPPAPAAKRITFATGGISATVSGTTRAVDVDHWVIAALGGQTMSVNLIVPPGGQAALVIYGADGTVLISDHASAMQWNGPLPKTQDYFIDVKPETGAVSYTLQVTIPPR